MGPGRVTRPGGRYPAHLCLMLRRDGDYLERTLTMAKEFEGKINVDIRDSTPDWSPFEPPKAPDGAPNVVYIVLDDVGFSAMSCYGGPIATPVWHSLAWAAGIAVIFAPLAVRRYRRIA